MTVHWTYAPDFKLPVLSALTIAMLALSFQAQALEAMGDEEMSESSGQAGRLQRPVSDRRGPRTKDARVRAAQTHGPGVVQTLCDAPVGGLGHCP